MRRKDRFAVPILGWLFALPGILAFGGCAPKPLYGWGDYEGSLRACYVDHDESEAQADLERTIAADQQSGQRVPPGAYAEYALLLYKSGQSQRAIEYFRLEATTFPESKVLMDKLVAKIQDRERSAGEASDTVEPAPDPMEDSTGPVGEPSDE